MNKKMMAGNKSTRGEEEGGEGGRRKEGEGGE
jgi:hypothetical protein